MLYPNHFDNFAAAAVPFRNKLSYPLPATLTLRTIAIICMNVIFRLAKQYSIRAFLAGLAAAMVVIALTHVLADFGGKNQRLQRRDMTLVNVSEMRSLMESKINSLLLTARGIIAYVELHGDIGQPEFERLAASLVGDNPLVVNMALLEGSVVKRVYPYERNRFVVGLDILTRPQHRDSFQRMVSSGQPVLFGPGPVLQGNLAFVGRVPIYRSSIANSSERGEYWGSTAMVIDAERLYDSIGLLPLRGDVRFALRRAGNGRDIETAFFGENSVFENQPISQKIRLPGNSYWEIAALPAQGWNYQGGLRRLAMILGYSLAALIGLLTYLLFRKQEQIRHNALHDSLSGLPNRRLFFDRFQQAIHASKRYKRSFAIVLLDLDGFKAVNDNLGHPAGDDLIRSTAQRLEGNIRASDTVARYGGDEFALLLMNSDEAEAMAIAEQLRLIVPSTLMHDEQSLHISASIGVAVYPEHGTSSEELLSKADEALYAAKNRGKNAVVTATPVAVTASQNS